MVSPNEDCENWGLFLSRVIPRTLRIKLPIAIAEIKQREKQLGVPIQFEIGEKQSKVLRKNLRAHQEKLKNPF